MSNECMSLPPLSECPFCGFEAEVKTLKRSTFFKKKQDAFYIRCNVCHATSQAVFTVSEAREAWNRRAGESNE